MIHGQLPGPIEVLRATTAAEREEMQTLRQACIALKVPRSGNDELDALILESRRLDFAAAALSGVRGIAPDDAADWSMSNADALLSAAGYKVGGGE